MQIDGLTYLLASDPAGNEHVIQYTRFEMEEVFDEAARRELNAGEAVIFGDYRYVDMIAAARAIVA